MGRAPVRPAESSSSTNGKELLPNDMEWSQDLPGDLDTFARLTRAGHFVRAESFYQEVLQEHERFFPVAAEYADMLIEQGAFGKAEDFLEVRLRDDSTILLSNPEPRYAEDEVLVLKLLHGIAKIHTKLCFEDAVMTAEEALKGLDVSRSSGEWSGVEVSYPYAALDDHGLTISDENSSAEPPHHELQFCQQCTSERGGFLWCDPLRIHREPNTS